MPSDHNPDSSHQRESSPPANDQPPAKQQAKEVSNQLTIAMELPFVMVAAVVVGGLFGYFLDRWLHTKPVFTLILGGIGFFAGVRDVLRRLSGGNDGTKPS